MRFLSYLTSFLIAASLASCGGGGGSPGVGSGSVQALAVAAPAEVTLQVGLTQQYSVKGGQKPYAVFSTNPAVAVGWLIGEDTIAVGTVTAGTAIVTLQDSKGAKFDIAVTGGSSTVFFSTAPAALTIAPGVLAAQTYKLGGGTPPYKAVSSNPSLLSVVVNGTDVTLTALRVPGTAAVTLTDSSSPPTSIPIGVTLGTIPLTVTTGTYKVFLGDTVRFVISGGTPPYRIIDPLDNTVTARVINGNEGEVTGIRVVDPVELIVIDANGQTAVAPKITFMAGGDTFLRVSPDAFTMPENANSPNIILNVFGVSIGSPITVFTTDNTLFTPGTPVKTKTDGTAYTITLTGGNTCYNGAGVDNTFPKDGDFTDVIITTTGSQPVADVPARPTKTVTITVLDSTGRRGTSVLTIADDGLGGAGCGP
ncbi:MAG: hypothetical protein V4858_29395 [Pseudomonadota bacterium]